MGKYLLKGTAKGLWGLSKYLAGGVLVGTGLLAYKWFTEGGRERSIRDKLVSTLGIDIAGGQVVAGKKEAEIRQNLFKAASYLTKVQNKIRTERLKAEHEKDMLERTTLPKTHKQVELIDNYLSELKGAPTEQVYKAKSYRQKFELRINSIEFKIKQLQQELIDLDKDSVAVKELVGLLSSKQIDLNEVSEKIDDNVTTLIRRGGEIQEIKLLVSESQDISNKINNIASSNLNNNVAFLNEYLTVRRMGGDAFDFWVANVKNYSKLEELMQSKRVMKLLEDKSLIRVPGFTALVGLTEEDMAAHFGTAVTLGIPTLAMKVISWLDNTTDSIAALPKANIDTLEVEKGPAKDMVEKVKKSVNEIVDSPQLAKSIYKDEHTKTVIDYLIKHRESLVPAIQNWDLVIKSAAPGDKDKAIKSLEEIKDFYDLLTSKLTQLQPQLT